MGPLAFAIPPRYPSSVPTTAFLSNKTAVGMAYACGYEMELESREKQNSNPRRRGAEQLPLQYGAKPIGKVLRADPGALPSSCMVVRGIFPGFLVQPRHDQARGVAGFSAAE